MTRALEETVEAFLATFHESDEPDMERILSFFTEDAAYIALVPATKAAVGHSGIRAALEKQFTSYKGCVCEIHAIGSNDHQVFTERSDHVTLLHDGNRIASRVCAVFDLDAHGKITQWREYWDTGDVLQQMGIDRSVLESYIN